MPVSAGSTSQRTTAPGTTPARHRPGSDDQLLRHVLVVGGTLAQWDALTAAEWDGLVDGLGAVVDRAGASFLTLRAYETGAAADAGSARHGERWERRVGQCLVIVDPCGDGRERFAESMRRLPPTEPVNEATVAEVLYEPADVEPDLIVVLGPSTRLPPSLVWELAYSELVFHPTAWQDLSPDDLLDAIADFATRSRRFGGLDES